MHADRAVSAVVTRAAAPPITNAMTVDVEDYFHVAAFEDVIDRSSWESRECRVERNVDSLLELFQRRGVRATFFMLGWVAERFPTMLRRILAAGHELASHGFEHRRVTTQNRAQFAADVTATRRLLEDIGGRVVRGYRAASYSINASNLWALDVLQEAGYQYSSSIYPIKHDLYGMPDAPRFAFHFRPGSILEIPVTTVRMFGRNWPCGGGGYFRLLPYSVSRRLIARVNRDDREPAIFYFHPWEIDPEQPRIGGASLRSRFRHYHNLPAVRERLERLLGDFAWSRMDEVFAARGQLEFACA
jgi:polysaccharide deacetylase family protein (PEP-CTERM system associated)